MFWPARRAETLVQRAIYKFHPIFQGRRFQHLVATRLRQFANATMEGGDVMPIGNRNRASSHGERTTYQAVVKWRRLCSGTGRPAGLSLPDA